MKTIFAMLAAFCLFSCGKNNDKKNDGNWDPMVWETEVAGQIANNQQNISATGAEIIFFCRNYSSPWISSAESNGEYYYPPVEANDHRSLTLDWFKAEINGNKLTVVIEANNTGEGRSIKLDVTAGDIFYTFVFNQSADI